MTWTVKLLSDELNVVTNALKACAETAGDGAYGKDFHLRLARKVALESDFSGDSPLRKPRCSHGGDPEKCNVGYDEHLT